MQRTCLEWDNYMPYLIAAINSSKFMKRAENKPMSTPKMPNESHISTRAMHLRESADVIKRLARGLGLNEEFAYAAMLMHDAGHPFSAHEGEEVFKYIGEMYYTHFFHHNAKGVEVILSEDICGQAISKIPGIENNPELRKKLEDEFYYFLDVIISHDGEASMKDLTKKEEQYDSIKDAVFDKLRRSNSENDYRFIAQTAEGKLAKYADVIAYLSSDLQDAFRLGILTDFDDNYLKMFGAMFSKEELATDEEKIAFAKKEINKIKLNTLSETRSFVLQEEDTDVLNAVNSFMALVEENGLDFFKSSPQEIEKLAQKTAHDFYNAQMQHFMEENNLTKLQCKVMEKRVRLKQGRNQELTPLEEKYVAYVNELNSKVNKLKHHNNYITEIQSRTVREITSRMQEYFIEDLIHNSQIYEENENGELVPVGLKERPEFSEKANSLFFAAKDLNYKNFVPHVKWDYQIKNIPKAVKKLALLGAKALIKSGIIRDKFYDGTIRSQVTNEEAQSHMTTRLKNSKKEARFKKRHDMEKLSSAKPTTLLGKLRGKTRLAKIKFCKSLFDHIGDEDRVFAIRYQNTYDGIYKRVEVLVRKSLGLITDEKEQKEYDNRLFKKESSNLGSEVRSEILSRYKTLDITPEQMQEYIDGKVAKEREDMEGKMAMQLALDYIAQMTDRSFVHLAEKAKYLSERIIKKAKRGVVGPSNALLITIKDHENNQKGTDR